MDEDPDRMAKLVQAAWICAGLLFVLVLLAILSLMKLGEIADAGGF